MTKEEGATTKPVLLPPEPIHELNWEAVAHIISEADKRYICRVQSRMRIDSLRQQVALVAAMIRLDLHIDITNEEISFLFRRKGGWAQSMMARYIDANNNDLLRQRGRPLLVDTTPDQLLLLYCLEQQRNQMPVTVTAAIDFMDSLDQCVDRFWVQRFVQRHEEHLKILPARVLDQQRQFLNVNDVVAYFNAIENAIYGVPSPFVWNIDETRVGKPKRTEPPNVIVAKETRPDAVTISFPLDDAQLTLVAGISAFGDYTVPMLISKNQTFDRDQISAQLFYEGIDYEIRRSASSFITEVLFVDWIQSVFLKKIQELRNRYQYEGKVVLIVDGHSSHVTPRVISYAATQKIVIIRLVAHSSHIAQPLDLCLFAVFKNAYQKEREVSLLKGEARKIVRALKAFSHSITVSVIRQSFRRAGYILNSQNPLLPLGLDPQSVTDRIALPDQSIVNDGASMPPNPTSTPKIGNRRIRQDITAPSHFAINLAAFAKIEQGLCPLCNTPTGGNATEKPI
jgi:hypothetical protein